MFLSSCAPFGTDANNIRALRVLILFHNEKEMDWGHKRSPPYSFYFLFFICMWWDLYFPVVAKSMAVYAPAVPFVSGWKIRTHAHLRRDESLVSIEAKWEEGDYCNKGKKKKNLRRCVLLLARGRCQKSSSHWGGVDSHGDRPTLWQVVWKVLVPFWTIWRKNDIDQTFHFFRRSCKLIQRWRRTVQECWKKKTLVWGGSTPPRLKIPVNNRSRDALRRLRSAQTHAFRYSHQKGEEEKKRTKLYF